jgi:DNA-binding response OmpR family regulator
VSSALRRVLVIDDQVDVRTMISIVLRIHHFEVVGTATAAAGLNEFDGAAFDVAIIDILLGRTSGLDAIVKIRERVPGFPIVAISGMTALDFVAESPELANVVCLRKPFRPAELVRATEVAIASRAVHAAS